MTDPELLATFIARAITPDQWTHETHLRVAWLFARDRPLDEAHILFRIALMKLNDRHGVPESLSRGYHGTITRAWLAVLGALARADPSGSSLEFLSARPELLRKEYLDRHYSPACLMSVEARARFVEPDRAALPGQG